jgi:hypothetical protein
MCSSSHMILLFKMSVWQNQKKSCHLEVTQEISLLEQSKRRNGNEPPYASSPPPLLLMPPPPPCAPCSPPASLLSASPCVALEAPAKRRPHLAPWLRRGHLAASMSPALPRPPSVIGVGSTVPLRKRRWSSPCRSSAWPVEAAPSFKRRRVCSPPARPPPLR